MSKIKEYNKCVDQLQQKLFRKPSEDEIAQYMDITKKEVISIRNKMKTSSNISIDHTVSEGEKEFSIIDTIEDEDILSVIPDTSKRWQGASRCVS